MDPDAEPKQLLNKFQSDIRYNFQRQGTENIYDTKKKTYQLAFDQKGVITYILQAKDDATKIHHENNNPAFARNMLENLGFDGNLHKMCCVHSFKLYPYLW